jgi:hypothetical protein
MTSKGGVEHDQQSGMLTVSFDGVLQKLKQSKVNHAWDLTAMRSFPPKGYLELTKHLICTVFDCCKPALKLLSSCHFPFFLAFSFSIIIQFKQS